MLFHLPPLRGSRGLHFLEDSEACPSRSRRAAVKREPKFSRHAGVRPVQVGSSFSSHTIKKKKLSFSYFLDKDIKRKKKCEFEKEKQSFPTVTLTLTHLIHRARFPSFSKQVDIARRRRRVGCDCGTAGSPVQGYQVKCSLINKGKEIGKK